MQSIKKWLPGALTLCLVLLATLSAEAQRKRTTKDPDEKVIDFDSEDGYKKGKKKKKNDSLRDKLWYGGGIGLGFGGNNGASSFALGVSPMVGYKLYGPFSAGARVAFNYTSYKERGFKNLSLFDWEVGPFVRSRIWGPIFAHGEYSHQWFQLPFEYDPANNRILKTTAERNNPYLGLGYNSTDPDEGGAGYEILLLYNFGVSQDVDSFESPFDIRFGFTWNF